jgi:uncharacterized protein YcaQ
MEVVIVNRISKEEAKNFLISYHNLDGSQGLQGEDGVMKYIKRVGCIQYDPLNVVGRNPDLVLQSRISNYSPTVLDKLLYERRSLIDGWDKMMSIYLQNDWPFFSRVRNQKEIEVKNILGNRDSLGALDLVEQVRGIIVNQGPIQSNQISIGTAKKGQWGHNKLSSATLDYMYNIGQIGIYEKRNTQKVYDMIEKLLPSELLNCNDPFENTEDFLKWYVKRRIGSVGLLWGKNGGGWLGHYISNKKFRTEILQNLISDGEILELNVEDIKDTFYIRKEDEHFLNTKLIGKQARFLAPLDNMLWDRGMIQSLFDFEYSWEVYVPIIKRKYGYYVLPVLYNNQLVARFEPGLHRNKEPLKILNWWWEDGIMVTDEMMEAIKDAFRQFCNYLQADGIDANEWVTI